MNRHAYLILAHTHPHQLKKLLAAIDDERNDIYIHLDQKADFSYEDLMGACKMANLVFIYPRIPVNWGGVSIIRAEMALLKEATKTVHTYYHFISGMDMPLKSQDNIHDFFEKNNGREFLEFMETDSHAYGRVQYYALFPEGSSFFLTNLLNHIFQAILKVLHLKQNKGIEVMKAYQWMSITHGFATYIVENEKWVEKVFRNTVICDEIFIPTLLWKSPFKDNLFNPSTAGGEGYTPSMRFIDWSRGPSRRHPWTFTSDDFEMLKNTPCLWARKFDENTDSAVIDRVLSELATK